MPLEIRMIWMKDVREDEILERNKNLNRGFRTLRVWREAIELYVFVKEALGGIKGLAFKIRDQILDSAFSIHYGWDERTEVRGRITDLEWENYLGGASWKALNLREKCWKESISLCLGTLLRE